MTIGKLFRSLLILFLLLMMLAPTSRAQESPTEPTTIVDSPDAAQVAVGSAFTYQGLLNSGGSPVSASCDFQFGLWNALTGGSQVGSLVTKTNVAVSKGAFTTSLDFGEAAFLSGEARWLQIAVRCPAGSGSYTTLTPRQALTTTPYALYSRGVWDFGGTGSLSAGTPMGNGPGWMIYAANGHRRDIVGDNLGVYIGASVSSNAANSTLSVHENGNVGIGVDVPTNGKLQVTTESGDAVRIVKAGDDGIQIGDGINFPMYGFFIERPGTTFTGVIANTAHANQEWGVFSDDKIRAANFTANTVTLVAVADGDLGLTAGDVVAAVGLAAPTLEDSQPLPKVALVSSATTSVIGVVESRMAWIPEPGKGEPGNPYLMLHSVPGPARAGDYVAITIAGVAQVKANAGIEPITVGQRLTSAQTPGQARALRSTSLDGMIVAEGAPVIGVALEPLSAGQDLIWVLVNPQ